MFLIQTQQWLLAGAVEISIFQWFEEPIANPATPATGFTRQIKRLVNFLNLRKNMKGPSLVHRWRAGGVGTTAL